MGFTDYKVASRTIRMGFMDGMIVSHDTWFICLFGVLRRFQHCTGHITTGSWKGRGNQYIEFARVVYCKLPTNGKQLPAFPLTAMTGIEPRPQRWEARVLPLCHRGPSHDTWELTERRFLMDETLYKGQQAWVLCDGWHFH